jgi:hypothetical protein
LYFCSVLFSTSISRSGCLVECTFICGGCLGQLDKHLRGRLDTSYPSHGKDCHNGWDHIVHRLSIQHNLTREASSIFAHGPSDEHARGARGHLIDTSENSARTCPNFFRVPLPGPATADLRVVPSFVSQSCSILRVRDEGQLCCAGAIACVELSSQHRPFGVSNFSTMRSLDRRRLADTVYQWHEDRHLDMQPGDTGPEAMEFCSCTSVRAAFGNIGHSAIEG